MERICGNCALKTLKGGICPIFNADMSNEKGCPYFTAELKTCDICGDIVPKGGIIDTEENTSHLLCQRCAVAPQCKICTQTNECRFQNDTSCTEPPMIIAQQRKGQMVIQTQVVNPKRIEATCAKGCSCYWAEGAKEGNFCLKQTGCGCRNYKIKWRN